MKKITLKTVLATTLSLAFLSGASYADQAKAPQAPVASSIKKADFPEIRPDINFARSAVIVSRVLTTFEYDNKPLDEALSREIFDAYFKALDSQKMFFIEKDIKSFESAKNLMGGFIETGDLRFAFDVFLLYRDRVAQRYDYALSLLNTPFDFTVDEDFVIDRKKAEWAKTDDEVNDLWRRRIKNDYLRLKLAKMDDDKIRERLRKRYTNNRNQIVRMKSEEVAEMFLNAYTDSTDPHTTYYSPTSAKNFDVQMSLSVEGIGAVLQKRDEYGQIREVVAGGPAARSGQLHPGDRIVAVGQGDNGPMEEVIDWRLDDIVKKIRGKRGSVVRIEVIPAEGGLDAEHRIIRIVREKVAMEDQAVRSKILELQIEGKTRKVGVITVPSFYEDFDEKAKGGKNYKSLTTDTKKILEDFEKKGVEAVVLDLRDNGGGSLNEAANFSGLFIGNGQTIVQVRSEDGDVRNVRSRGIDKVWDKPVVVIVNRISASASEIFAGAIQDYQRGVIVGDATWGKGTVQTFRSLTDFLRNPKNKEELGALKWTIQKFFRVNGSSTQVKGVTPDILFPSRFDPEELGESSYENAMPWSEIPAAAYKPVNKSVKGMIKTLTQKHKDRVKDSGSWKLMLDETEHALALSQRKSYSLNLKKREQEREKMNETYKSFEARRKALGEEDIATFQLDDGLAAGEGNLKEELEKEKKRKENIDTIAREAAHIALDMSK